MCAPAFPSANHPFAGVFSARIAETMSSLGHDVVVLSPRPLVPPGFGRVSRWRQFAGIPSRSEWSGMPVYRPVSPVVPRWWSGLWSDVVPFIRSRSLVRRLHRAAPFDAVFGFDVQGAGGLAWRIGRRIGVPSAGWAFGDDVRHASESSVSRSVANALRSLDLVLYQSAELRLCANQMVSGALDDPLRCDRHVVLPHGIPLQPQHSGADDAVPGGSVDGDELVWIGRIVREKGPFEVLDAVEGLLEKRPTLRVRFIGALPDHDDSAELGALISQRRRADRISVEPAVPPDAVRPILHDATVLLFTSPREGMPNVVLEAMDCGTAVVGGSIPPLHELDPRGQCLWLVDRNDPAALAAAIDAVLSDPVQRAERIRRGREIVDARFDMFVNVAAAMAMLVPPSGA